MHKIIFFVMLLIAATANGQYKADNVKYTTVFPEDLCKTLLTTQGYTLLDVRSQGEYDDTLASSEDLNIGHLKNALHIDVRELPGRWRELLAYKDKPLFIYCSHSQRSRRASRLLADSGFTKVFNINGGLTNFYNQGIESNPCSGLEIVTTVPYKIISPKEFASNSQQRKSYYIIDLRSDSIFNGISTEKTRAEGKFIDAINIPFKNFSPSAVPASKSILLVDEYGDESPEAAKMLIDKGYKDVMILFDGMDGWLDYVVNTETKDASLSKSYINYSLISGDRFNELFNKKTDLVVIDLRTKEEFTNTSKNYWQNIGQVKDAVNIPYTELKDQRFSAKIERHSNRCIRIWQPG